MPNADPLGLSLSLVALGLAMLAVFAVWPGIDLYVTGLFHVPGQGFPVADTVWVDGSRRAVWGASIFLCLATLPALALAVWRGAPVLRLDARDWGFILTMYALGPGLLVEELLKKNWGRARPAQIEQFGGTQTFTAPQVMSDQCAINCSFTSGEVAGATVLAIAMVLFLLRWRPAQGGRARIVWVAAILAVPVLTGVQRLAAGRHFLSDILFSAVLMLLLAVVLSRLFGLRKSG